MRNHPLCPTLHLAKNPPLLPRMEKTLNTTVDKSVHQATLTRKWNYIGSCCSPIKWTHTGKKSVGLRPIALLSIVSVYADNNLHRKPKVFACNSINI